MSTTDNSEPVFEPLEIAIEPPINDVVHVTVSRIDAADGYYVFRAVDAEGREVGGTSARTAIAAAEAMAENAEADIRAALAL